ncbi:MAG: N-acyl-D-amino-acid deacylase family protein, partial [Candidatus Heimdallarchaeaceae archaeon]
MIYDILIKDGKVIDGTGNIGFYADIGIKKGKILKIGFQLKEKAKKMIDAKGLIVCPGFIDAHSHTDFSIPFDNKLQSLVTQGITTSIVGQCGTSLAPISEEGYEVFMRDAESFGPPGVEMDISWMTFKEYLKTIEKTKIASNIVPLVGFATIRIACGLGYENREPTKEELEKMKGFVREAMEAGAFGMSTGLIYSPQVFAKTEEIIEVAKAVAEYKGLYFSHIRDEGPHLIEAVKEAIEIVEKSGCRGGQISHHKASGKPNWGKTKETLKLIEEANNRGLDITCDQYPYNRGATSLMTILPAWAHEGGLDEILQRLASKEERKKMRKDILKPGKKGENWYNDIGPKNIFISSVKTEKWREMEGKSIEEITKLTNKKDG